MFVAPVKTHTADAATRLIDNAGTLLSQEGAAALTLRRVAAASGTSTMAVYTLFGDKQGLLAAMYREGFARLGRAMRAAAAEHSEPLEALAALGATYRRTALANPHLYDLMFGRPVAGFVPDEDSQAVADAAYQPLVDAVQNCLDAGQLVGSEAGTIAFHLWSVTHGLVSLELAGQPPDATRDRAATYDLGMVLSVAPFLP